MHQLSRSHRSLCLGVLLTFAFCFCLSHSAAAHPMGNFSINHYARLEAQARQLTIRYVLDFAEIPTVTERETMGVQGNAPVLEAASQAYLRAKALTLRDGLTLTVDGVKVPLAVTPVALQFRPGAGGLNTMRLVLDLAAPLSPARAGISQITYRDDNYAERTGWKEIVAGAGADLALQNSSASGSDISKELTVYPANPTLAPPQQMEATFTVVPAGTPALGGAAASPSAATGPQPQASNTHTPQDAFTQAIARRKLTPGVILLGLLFAFVFGAFHALSPGHGKTMVAAYLVGSRGTPKHAVLLGIIVTVTHTFGVFLLGLITLFASQYIVPEKLYPVLSVLSGLAVFGVGVWLLTSRLRGISDGHSDAHSHDHGHSHSHDDGHTHDHDHAHDRPDEIHLSLIDAEAEHEYAHAQGLAHSHAHDHSHSHDHGHTHSHDHGHSHSHDGGHTHGHGFGQHTHDVPEGPVTLKMLLALGISGGIVPCPSALVVLLSAIALHRVGYGLVLISAFSLGLASVLVGIGLLVVSARRFADRIPASGPFLQRLPIVSAAAITLIGVMLVVRAVTQGV